VLCYVGMSWIGDRSSWSEVAMSFLMLVDAGQHWFIIVRVVDARILSGHAWPDFNIEV
jgi:hypothetical protein